MRLSASILLATAILAGRLAGQVPAVGTPPDTGGEIRAWLDAGASHVARQSIRSIVSRRSRFEQDRGLLFLLVESSFSDRDYEEAYRWAGEFNHLYPNDAERTTALFIEGVSAYQTHRNGEALAQLDLFLSSAPDDRRRSAATFWRAMAYLDRGNWQKAEDDMQSCIGDTTDRRYREYAVFGWALSLERRGRYADAAVQLERLLADYPGSDLRTDAEIRLASVTLRENRPGKSLDAIARANPSYDYQWEELLLLRAEASMQTGRYADARTAYDEYARRYDRGRFSRFALYGLAWSEIRQHEYLPARRILDSLSRVRDSLGFTAMYGSGVLSLLEGDNQRAKATFDTLTDHSPYDDEAAEAYYQSGLIDYREKRYRDALHDFQLTAQLFPVSRLRPAAYHMLGEASFALGDYANAQYAFVQVHHLTEDPALLIPALFHQGIALYHLGRFRSSVEAFSEFLRIAPEHRYTAEAYAWKGEALFQDYRFADAEQTFSDALKKFPDNPKRADAAYGLAWSWFELKEYPKAAAAFVRFGTDFPNDPRAGEASLRTADAYFSMGEYDKANALYSTAAARNGGRQTEYASFQYAMSFVQRGDANRGIDELRSFLAKYPSSIYDEVAQFNIAWTFFSREMYREAIVEFTTLLKLYAESQLLPRVLFNMGDSYYNLKNYDSARIYYKRVIDEFPTSLLVSDALSGLQYTNKAQGKPAAAIPEIDQVLKSSAGGERKEELEMKKADILFDQGDFAGALNEYGKVVSGSTSKQMKGKALYQMGRAFELNENLPRAAEYYERVIAETPETDVSPTAMLALGLCRIRMKNYTQAIQALEDFPRRFPDSPLLPEVRYQTGVAMMSVPEGEKALGEFRGLIAAYPDHIFAERSRLRMAEIYQNEKQYQTAVDTLSGIMSRRNDDFAAEALLRIGDAYYAMKKIRDAMQAYNDIVRQYTDYPRSVERAKRGLAIAYERQNDRKRARSLYQEIANSTTDPDLKKEAEEKLRKLRK
ncbi:MAG TPA: tetratricopeptide repeat protein [Bacteroidota bacterium]|nr:tetratricopeptide repeat protein [Bacteroidota bacterium]